MERIKYIKPQSKEYKMESMVLLAGSDTTLTIEENNHTDSGDDGTNDFEND